MFNIIWNAHLAIYYIYTGEKEVFDPPTILQVCHLQMTGKAVICIILFDFEREV